MRIGAGYVELLMVTATVALVVAGCAGDHRLHTTSAELLLANEAPGAVETNTVAGQMIALRDAAPIPGLEVVVGSALAVTDAEGRFVVEGVPVGMQRLTVNGGDYAILGGAMRIEVTSDVNDVGRVIVDLATAGLPPAVPVFRTD